MDVSPLPGLGFWRGDLRRLAVKRSFFIVTVAMTIVVLGIAATWFFGISRTFKPRVVLYAKTPDGTEVCVFQEFTGTTEPYKTSFFSRKSGDRWGWYYYDHQDLAWISGHIDLDVSNKIATVFRGTKPVAKFYWTNDQFVHLLRGTTNGPEETPNMWTSPPSVIIQR